MLVLLNGGSTRPLFRHYANVALVDACVTEWRIYVDQQEVHSRQLHSLMLVLLNGGTFLPPLHSQHETVALVDACVTEWRIAVSAPPISRLFGCTR